MKCERNCGMYDDELLLSFGDDTIAAINQLEISRFVSDLSPKDNVQANNISQVLSQRQSLGTSSPLQLVSKHQDSTLNVSSEKSVSPLCTQQKCDLAMWGLPAPVLEQYQAHGIKSMFHWQVQCLCDPEVLGGRNLVYSAPTSAGKTLVAELLTIKTVLEKKKKAVIILPFVSVVREKMFYFKSLLETSGVRVEGLMGGHNVHGGFKNVDIAVCTIEKANGLINRLMEEECLHQIGIVVVDELHLLGDPFRGYLLELLITKIRYMSTVNSEINIQLIGMSATLPNLDLLASWLDAHLYKTDFRPIPLNEHLKIGHTIYSKSLEVERTLEPKYEVKDDPDHVIHLCLETIFSGHSSLIFCPTKNWCEKLAISIAKELYNIGSSASEIGLKLREQLKSEAIAEALQQLKACPVGLDNALAKSIAFGVGFHHAGLTIDERDIIEALFRSGVVRVLAATSTLSSGVNLPARRVLIRTPVFHRRPLDVQVYKQMVGRAGRMGKDTEGESFLLCNKTEQKIGEQLIQEGLKPIVSCLGQGELSSSLKRAILEVIASGVAETPEQVKCYANCTLLAISHTGLENPIASCITFLLENECIRLQVSEDNVSKYLPTPLGNACLAASMSPDDGLELFQELQKARQCFVLENELHLVYLVTPYSVSAQWSNLDWMQIMSFWEKLPPSMQRVGKLVGIDEGFMIRALRGTVNLRNHKQIHKLSVHRRFYTALALQELVNEIPLIEVAKKYQCSKGMLQSLQQTSATFAGMVTAFCKRLGWRNLELLVSQFQDRLQFGVHRELCELMRLDLLNGPRARALFNAGIKSLGDLASASICQVENALHKTITFQTSKEMEGETAYDAAYRNQMKTIWITGREGLTEREAAVVLVKEAQIWLQEELGLTDVKWGSNCSKASVDVSSDVNICSNSSDHTQIQCSKLDDAGKDLYNKNDTVEESQPFDRDSENEMKEVTSPCTLHREQNAMDIKCESDEVEIERGSCVETKLREAIVGLGCNEMSNSKKVDDLKNISKNGTVQESQMSGTDSDDEMTEKDLSQTKLIMSPLSDIFDTSDSDTDVNVGTMKSGNNSISSFSRVDVLETKSDGALSTTVIISTSENHESSTDDCQEMVDAANDCKLNSDNALEESLIASNGDVSRFSVSRQSLDMFASPIPTTCKSPSMFEESLIINSHLGNLLDKSEANCVELSSSVVYEKKSKKSNEHFSEILHDKHFESSHKNENVNFDMCGVKDRSASDSLQDIPVGNTVQVHQPPKPGDKTFSDINVDLQASGRISNSEFLIEERNQHFLSQSQVQGHIEGGMKNGNEMKVQEEGAVLQSSLCNEVLTESFLKQAFTTICDFGNSDGDILQEKHSIKSTQDVNANKIVDEPGIFQKSKDDLGKNFKKQKIGNVSSETCMKVPNCLVPSKKMKISPTPQISDNFVSNATYVVPDDNNQCIKMGLTFVSDSDEGENDLVPSSQSQSDISMYPASSCSSLSWKTKQNKKSPSAKRKRREKKETVKSTTNVIDSQIRKWETHGNAPWETFKIVDVCAQRKIFGEFKEQLKLHSHISVSVACERHAKESPKSSIGDKILGRKPKKESNVKKLLVGDNRCVVGLAVCLGDKCAYYISLDSTSKVDSSPGSVSFGEQLDLVECLFARKGEHFLSAFDMKEQYKILYQSCAVNIEKEICDPKVAEWMLDSECDEKSLRLLMMKYLPDSLKLIRRVGNISGAHSLGLYVRSTVRGRVRASVEAVVTWHLINTQLKVLDERNLLKVYREVEMPTILCLTCMEIYGIGFCRREVEKLHTVLQNQLEDLEQQAYRLAQRSFSLSSPNDVAKVLFKELQLKTWKYTSGHKPSTNKEVLLKLRNNHPLPSVILEWRKIQFIMSKIILPFLKVGTSERIFGHYITHTATGRINMHEPNLQSIPRDFDISAEDSKDMTVSMRVAFIPKKGKTFVSADYSQLELRLLAHLSQDNRLVSILKSGGDIFKNVAAAWNKITEEEVTDNLRQRAKQVCYGVIYGIGASALSEQLEVDEEDAALFMETFLNAYPGLKKFRRDVVQKCKEKGFVETLHGRKRFLPAINSNKLDLKAQAERQAVNTTVQGSAADIAKTGMVLVEASLKAAFLNESSRIRRLRENKRQCLETSTATLVLHLHDELLYEVSDEYINEVVHIIKGGMEAAANLTVPLPVRVKCGKSWGALKEII